MRQILTLMLLGILLILVGCRATNQATIDNLQVDIALDTDTPTVGDANLLLTLTTDDGSPVEDASVSVRGDMTHAGMVPVLVDPVTDSTNGVYTIPIQFTMSGDWIFTVTIELANGDTTELEYTVDAVANDNADMDMDMSDDMSDMTMTSAVSGVYMTITNNRESDVTLVSVTAEGVGMAQIHETTVDERDMASMDEIEEGLLIPAGATVELIPGGLHIMLMNLENDLVEGDSISVTLEFDDGNTITTDIPVALMMPMDEIRTTDVDGLVITGEWARPTAVEDMSDMDMPAEATEASE